MAKVTAKSMHATATRSVGTTQKVVRSASRRQLGRCNLRACTYSGCPVNSRGGGRLEEARPCAISGASWIGRSVTEVTRGGEGFSGVSPHTLHGVSTPLLSIFTTPLRAPALAWSQRKWRLEMKVRILLAIDQFEPGQAAVDFAIGLAAKSKADVLVFHVREVPSSLGI